MPDPRVGADTVPVVRTGRTRGWAEVPASTGGRPDAAGPSAAWWRWPLAALVAALGPVLRTQSITVAPRPLVVLAAAILGLAVASTLPQERRLLRLLAAGAAGLCAMPAGGVWTGVWLALTIPLAEWSVLLRPPSPRLPSPGNTALPGVLVITAVAALQGRDPFARHLPVILTGVALVVTFTSARFPAGMERAVERVGHWAGVAVGTLLFGILGLLVVVAPWVVDRVAFVDPTAAPHRRGSNWVLRQRGAVQPDRPWSHTATVHRPRRGPRVRRGLVVGVVVTLLVAMGVVAYLRRGPSVPIPADENPGSNPAAFEGVEWWPDYLKEMDWVFFEPGVAYNPLRYPGMGEVHTRHINIEDGRRRSWTAPRCDCPTLTLWAYGGSTMVGMGQRDDHTISSELARLAWRDGIRLEVHNRGVLGDLHWEEAQRFAWDVESEEPPDAVVFYSGSNDIVGTEYRDGLGEGLDGSPVDWTAEIAFEENTAGRRALEALPSLLGGGDAPPGASIPPTPEVDPLPATELGRFVAEQYERARQVALRTAEAHDVAATWFWQPARYTRPPVDGEPQKDAEFERYQREAYRAAAAALGSDVHDISGVFDDVPRPIFYDDVHTNEEGAALVARAIYDVIRPELVRLRDASSAVGPSQANG